MNEPRMFGEWIQLQDGAASNPELLELAKERLMTTYKTITEKHDIKLEPPQFIVKQHMQVLPGTFEQPRPEWDCYVDAVGWKAREILP